MSAVDRGSPPTNDPCWPLMRLTAVLVEIARATHRESPGQPPADDAGTKDGAPRIAAKEKPAT